MKIEYKEEFGKLKFICYEGERKLSGAIPNKIIDKGDAAINQYVQARMLKHLNRPKKTNVKSKRKKREERIEKRVKNTNVLISLKYKDQNLRGRIINYKGEDNRGEVTIILESPKQFKGRDYIATCFGMGIMGIQVFDEEGRLTEWTINEAKEMLIEIYEQNKKQKIAEKLNKNQ